MPVSLSSPYLPFCIFSFSCIATQKLAQRLCHALVQEVSLEPQTPLFNTNTSEEIVLRNRSIISQLFPCSPGCLCRWINAASQALPQPCMSAQGHQHFCSFPAASHSSLSCSCSAESLETARDLTQTALSKYIRFANLNTESLARAWPPLREAQKPWEALADPKIQGSLELPAFPLLQNNHRCDSNHHPTASAKNRVTELKDRDQPWDQRSPIKWNHFIPNLFGEWQRGGTSRNVFLAENFTPNCSSEFHTDLTYRLCWSIDLPTAQGCFVSASSLCDRHLGKAPGSAQVTVHSLSPLQFSWLPLRRQLAGAAVCNHMYCSILAFLGC